MALLGAPQEVPIPHEKGEHLVLCGVGGAVIEEAARIQTMRQIEIASVAQGIVSDDAIKRAQEARSEAKAKEGIVPTVSLDPDDYDVGKILVGGLHGWSYDDPFTTEGIDRLDYATREWAHREILTRSLPRPPVTSTAGGSS